MANWKTTESEERTVPEVGQFWRHVGGNKIYMRISDDLGEKSCGHQGARKTYFFSIDDNSAVHVTFRNGPPLEIVDVSFRVRKQ